MSAKIAKLGEVSPEVREFLAQREIHNPNGHGTLPSTCNECQGPLDFNKLGLICRDCKHQIVLD